MKRFLIISLSLILFYSLISCQKKISFFNHVPKDYYTRHHSNEIKSQKREPILCLKKSGKEDFADKTIITPKKQNSSAVNIDNDYSVSIKSFETFEYNPLWALTDKVSYSVNLIEDSELEKKKKKKLSIILGIGAALIGFFGVFSIFSGSPELFLGLMAIAVALAIVSSNLKPEKREIKAENLEKEKSVNQETEEEKKKINEPLTDEERKALEVETLGFLSFISGFFSILITILSIGFPLLLAFVPFLVAISLIFGIYSLKKHKNNPQKFRGKGYAITGIVIGTLYLLSVLIAFIAILAFFL